MRYRFGNQMATIEEVVEQIKEDFERVREREREHPTFFTSTDQLSLWTEFNLPDRYRKRFVAELTAALPEMQISTYYPKPMVTLMQEIKK